MPYKFTKQPINGARSWTCVLPYPQCAPAYVYRGKVYVPLWDEGSSTEVGENEANSGKIYVAEINDSTGELLNLRFVPLALPNPYSAWPRNINGQYYYPASIDCLDPTNEGDEFEVDSARWCGVLDEGLPYPVPPPPWETGRGLHDVIKGGNLYTVAWHELAASGGTPARLIMIPIWSFSQQLLAFDPVANEIVWRVEGWAAAPNASEEYSSILVHQGKLLVYFDRITFEAIEGHRYPRDVTDTDGFSNWVGGQPQAFLDIKFHNDCNQDQLNEFRDPEDVTDLTDWLTAHSVDPLTTTVWGTKNPGSPDTYSFYLSEEDRDAAATPTEDYSLRGSRIVDLPADPTKAWDYLTDAQHGIVGPPHSDGDEAAMDDKIDAIAPALERFLVDSYSGAKKPASHIAGLQTYNLATGALVAENPIESREVQHDGDDPYYNGVARGDTYVITGASAGARWVLTTAHKPVGSTGVPVADSWDNSGTLWPSGAVEYSNFELSFYRIEIPAGTFPEFPGAGDPPSPKMVSLGGYTWGGTYDPSGHLGDSELDVTHYRYSLVFSVEASLIEKSKTPGFHTVSMVANGGKIYCRPSNRIYTHGQTSADNVIASTDLGQAYNTGVGSTSPDAVPPVPAP